MLKPAGGKIFQLVSIVGVTAYLAVVLCYLLIRGRLVAPLSLSSLISGTFRKPYAGCLITIEPFSGVGYLAPVPSHLISDQEDGMSKIVVYEDGYPLPQPHSIHDDVASKGAGRYSHWGASVVFSSTDNTDPRTNGRIYSAREVR